jgi:hypothetical protein
MIEVCSAKISRICWETLVDLEAWLHENKVRALPLRGHRGHGGPDAELPRFVAGRRHNAAFARSSDRNKSDGARTVETLPLSQLQLAAFKSMLTVAPNPTLFDKNVDLDFQYLLNRPR